MPYEIKHGGFGTIEYRAWINMKCRVKKKPRYVSKGISICERWNSFENFRDDMGERPSSYHSVERINNAGNYEPSNCRWATRLEQSQNTDCTLHITALGETKCASEWARDARCQVSMTALLGRINKGWKPERAITQQSRNHK